MNLEKFLKANLIKKLKPDFNQISKQIKRAQKDLKTAESVFNIDLTWTFAIAYHAMMRASKALMFSKGYLPTAHQSHKTIVEFARMILGDEYESLVSRFNRMRRQRHDFIYDSENNITQQEAKSAIETANKLLAEIVSSIESDNPQKNLFP